MKLLYFVALLPNRIHADLCNNKGKFIPSKALIWSHTKQHFSDSWKIRSLVPCEKVCEGLDPQGTDDQAHTNQIRYN